MPIDQIAAQLQAYKDKTDTDKSATAGVAKESPFERVRREIQQELARDEAYRFGILRHVPTFGKS